MSNVVNCMSCMVRKDNILQVVKPATQVNLAWPSSVGMQNELSKASE